jgi:DNA-binding NtrC family response regulator
MAATILIIDDEPKMNNILKRTLAKDGYEVLVTEDPEEGLRILERTLVQVILCDLKMPKLSGIQVLERAREMQKEADFIMMTAYASVQTAVESMKKGAFDYIIKPFPIDELKMLLRRVLETKSLKEENVILKELVRERFCFENIVAASEAMKQVIERAAKVAPTNSSVLLRGESGTGKEILAKAIHNASQRREKPLIIVNCSAIPETLLESELFGHTKGAFTGAIETRKGLFEAGDKGTIFLDEIGDISPALQVKLLRVLQEGEYQRVGDPSPRRVDVRIVSATNQDLERAVAKGTFRQDLYYRLNVVPIYIPPLRERREDIPPLIEYFVKRYADAPGAVEFDREALDVLLAYDWPGNIRELENAVEHAVVMCDGRTIRLNDLPLALQNFHARQHFPESLVAFDHLTLEEMEKRSILNALKKTGVNYTRAARLLGITRRTLGYRVNKYNLEDAIAQIRAQATQDDESENEQ